MLKRKKSLAFKKLGFHSVNLFVNFRRQEAVARRSGPKESLAPNGHPDLPLSLQVNMNSYPGSSEMKSTYRYCIKKSVLLWILSRLLDTCRSC